MMAIVKKEYDVENTDKVTMDKIKAEFDKEPIGSLAFHYFPLEKEVEL